MNLTLTWKGIEYGTLEKCLVKANAEGYEVVSQINDTCRFTSLDTGFTADIDFTEDLFVQHYPGLFHLTDRF